MAIDDRSATYDRQTAELMARLLRPDSNCVDVGAHTGAILQHMVEFAPRGAHHAFEALPHLAAALATRFPGVTVHQAAVGDSAGEADFHFVENDPGYSGLRRRLYDRPDPRIRLLRVRVVTLDQAIPATAPVAFVKIDIEGGEYHALRGAAETIRRARPVIVFEAGRRSTGQYGVTAAAMHQFVTHGLGYQLSTMKRWFGGDPPLTADEFAANFAGGPDYFFLAMPEAQSAGENTRTRSAG